MEDTASKPQRRLIVPERKTKADLQMNTAKDIGVDSIMADALQTAAIEIVKFRTMVGRGVSLDLKQSRIVQGWIECLLKVSKEQRERDRALDLANLSDEEMITLAKKVLNNDTSVVEVESSKDDESED